MAAEAGDGGSESVEAVHPTAGVITDSVRLDIRETLALLAQFFAGYSLYENLFAMHRGLAEDRADAAGMV